MCAYFKLYIPAVLSLRLIEPNFQCTMPLRTRVSPLSLFSAIRWTFSTSPLLGQGIMLEYSKSVAATSLLAINPPGFRLLLKARFFQGVKWRNGTRKASDIKTGIGQNRTMNASALRLLGNDLIIPSLRVMGTSNPYVR
jgi:hypothetical protein